MWFLFTNKQLGPFYILRVFCNSKKKGKIRKKLKSFDFFFLKFRPFFSPCLYSHRSPTFFKWWPYSFSITSVIIKLQFLSLRDSKWHEWTTACLLTVVLDVAAAPLQHPGHLSVDGVEAELGLGPPLRRAARRLLQLELGRVGELQCLQQARLTIYEVGDGVHGQTALQRKELQLTFQIKSLSLNQRLNRGKLRRALTGENGKNVFL